MLNWEARRQFKLELGVGCADRLFNFFGSIS
jgi:hypothetical protein